jgi:hypothetical protein
MAAAAAVEWLWVGDSIMTCIERQLHLIGGDSSARNRIKVHAMWGGNPQDISDTMWTEVIAPPTITDSIRGIVFLFGNNQLDDQPRTCAELQYLITTTADCRCSNTQQSAPQLPLHIVICQIPHATQKEQAQWTRRIWKMRDEFAVTHAGSVQLSQLDLGGMCAETVTEWTGEDGIHPDPAVSTQMLNEILEHIDFFVNDDDDSSE